MTNRRLVFSHIPKTAGTSVRRNLKEAFEKTLENYVEVGVYDMTNWSNRTDYWVKPEDFGTYSIPSDWSFCYGHITINQFLTNPALDPEDENIVLLSFVRDPVDRLISTYNFISLKNDHPLHAECVASKSVDFFYKLSQINANLQFNYLNCSSDLKWKFVVAASNRVAQTCAETFELVTSSRLDGNFFERKFNITGELPSSTKAHSISRAQFSADEIRALYDMHSLDQRIYDAVSSSGVLFTNPVWML